MSAGYDGKTFVWDVSSVSFISPLLVFSVVLNPDLILVLDMGRKTNKDIRHITSQAG